MTRPLKPLNSHMTINQSAKVIGVILMKYPRWILLFQCVSTLAFGQVTGNSMPASRPNQPEALVRSLYAEVVARHPLGISIGAENMKVFGPFLSKALLHRIDLAMACDDDWVRQNPDPSAKPPGLEGGLFTGDDLRAEPSSFRIVKKELEKDSSVRVYVKLTHDQPGESPWTWHVAAVLVRENSHLVVDDVIYLRNRPQDVDVRLSKYLTAGCDGPHWVGHGNKESGVRKQK
jgi:hypothetical protein